jgi:hypothetical protein
MLTLFPFSGNRNEILADAALAAGCLRYERLYSGTVVTFRGPIPTEMISMRQLFALAFAVAALATITLDFADARGRTGSHRSGGYNSHGKGSHYYGGH